MIENRRVNLQRTRRSCRRWLPLATRGMLFVIYEKGSFLKRDCWNVKKINSRRLFWASTLIGSEVWGYTALRPISPSCLEPGLPIQTTLHRMAFSSSSPGMTSTTCPRFSRKPPRRRKPPSERSTIRQGTLWGCEPRLTTTLAPLLTTVRLVRRASYAGDIGTALSSTVIFHITPIMRGVP